jgi:hypothetical protein
MSGMKKPIVIVAIVIGVILLVLIVAPFFINADQFRPQIETSLSQELGRKVQLGHVSVSLFSGSLSVDQISIADDPADSSQPFLTAKSLSVGIDVMPLIFSRDLRVHSLKFNDPQVQLLRTAAGQWNFASLGSGAPAAHTEYEERSPAGFRPVAIDVGMNSAQANAGESSTRNSFSVDKMEISNGTIVFGRPGQPTGPAYQDVNLSAQNVSQSAAFPFQFDAKTPGGGKIDLTGNLGPIGNNDGSHLPFEGRLKADSIPAPDIENLLAVLGYSLPSGSNLKGGTIQANLALHGPLEQFVAEGPVKLSNVTLTGFSLASKLSGALGQGGSGGNDTLIKVAEGALRYNDQGVRGDNLNVEIASIGSVTGAGTVSPENVLNFRLVAKLEGKSPIAKLTQISLFNKGGGIPFRVEGNASNPQVAADVPGLSNTPLNQLKVPSKGQLGSVLGGLLKKKNPQ